MRWMVVVLALLTALVFRLVPVVLAEEMPRRADWPSRLAREATPAALASLAVAQTETLER